MDSRDSLFGQKSHLILFCVIPGLLLNFSVSLLPHLETGIIVLSPAPLQSWIKRTITKRLSIFLHKDYAQ